MIASVVFTSQDLTFTVKRASILRLAKYISEKMGKITFAPGELARIYDIVVSHIDSRLSPEELSTLLSHIRLWIDQGGSIEFVEKPQK